MSISIFSNKAVIPDDTSLAEVFGNTNTLWDHIFEYVKEKSDALGEWKFYSKKSGMVLCGEKRKTNIVLHDSAKWIF